MSIEHQDERVTELLLLMLEDIKLGKREGEAVDKTACILTAYMAGSKQQGSEVLQTMLNVALAKIEAMSAEEFRKEWETAGYAPIWK